MPEADAAVFMNSPSAPIEYHITEPTPYESYDKYLWFIARMKEELKTSR
jgi:hypothetical protein